MTVIKRQSSQYKPHTWFKHGLSLDHHNQATSKVTKNTSGWFGFLKLYLHHRNTNTLSDTQRKLHRDLSLNKNLPNINTETVNEYVCFLFWRASSEFYKYHQHQKSWQKIRGKKKVEADLFLLEKNRKKKIILKVIIHIKITNFEHTRQLHCKTDVLHSLNPIL